MVTNGLCYIRNNHGTLGLLPSASGIPNINVKKIEKAMRLSVLTLGSVSPIPPMMIMDAVASSANRGPLC